MSDTNDMDWNDHQLSPTDTDLIREVTQIDKLVPKSILTLILI